MSLADDVVDALARGRMTLAEAGAIPSRELDALFALAAEYLDTERDQEAADILTGLVTLYPYSARFWRGLGVALHRLMLVEQARAAYDAALLLAPDHLTTLCYRGEAHLYLGHLDQARKDLERATKSTDKEISRRAAELRKMTDSLDESRDFSEPEPVVRHTGGTALTLADGRPLPLKNGRFVRADDEVTLVALREDTRQSAQRLAPTPLSRNRKSEDTARLPNRERTAPDVTTPEGTAEPARKEVTRTAVVARRLGESLTEVEEPGDDG